MYRTGNLKENMNNTPFVELASCRYYINIVQDKTRF